MKHFFCIYFVIFVLFHGGHSENKTKEIFSGEGDGGFTVPDSHDESKTEMARLLNGSEKGLLDHLFGKNLTKEIQVQKPLEDSKKEAKEALPAESPSGDNQTEEKQVKKPALKESKEEAEEALPAEPTSGKNLTKEKQVREVTFKESLGDDEWSAETISGKLLRETREQLAALARKRFSRDAPSNHPPPVDPDFARGILPQDALSNDTYVEQFASPANEISPQHALSNDTAAEQLASPANETSSKGALSNGPAAEQLVSPANETLLKEAFSNDTSVEQHAAIIRETVSKQPPANDTSAEQVASPAEAPSNDTSVEQLASPANETLPNDAPSNNTLDEQPPIGNLSENKENNTLVTLAKENVLKSESSDEPSEQKLTTRNPYDNKENNSQIRSTLTKIYETLKMDPMPLEGKKQEKEKIEPEIATVMKTQETKNAGNYFGRDCYNVILLSALLIVIKALV